MYAVIKTGGKQYRVQAGDVLVVEKLDGEPGAQVRFDQVLMLGDEGGATIGAPLVDGAAVTATLIETRKGEKVKIFKKTRRQGYRRTRGHRQPESVLRVTDLAGAGKTDKWDGTVDLTTKAELDARARGLAARVAAEDAKPAKKAKAVTPKGVDAEAVVTDGGKDPIVHATVVEHADAVAEAPSKKAAPKKAAAPKAAAEETKAPAKKAPAKKAKPTGDE
jgi:large subunit ribosomal protein L21